MVTLYRIGIVNSTGLEFNLIITFFYCFILVYLFVFTAINSNKVYHEKKLFLHCIGWAFGLVISDFFWNVLSLFPDSVDIKVGYVVNFCYFFFVSLLCSFWCLYSEFRLKSTWYKNRLLFFIVSLPMIFYIVMIVLTPFTKLFYYIEEPLVYKRGQLFHVINCIPMIYIFLGGVHACYKGLKKNRVEYRNEYLGLSSFVLLPLILWIFQVLISSVSFSMMGIVLGLFFVYDREKNQLITQDFLTNINNRNKLFAFASKKLLSLSTTKSFYLYIIDLNDFKLVNDKYGHVEGDFALCRFAVVLKNVASELNGFISRYGGDEFVLLVDTPPNEDPQNVILLIKNKVDEENKLLEKPYKLSACVGYCHCKKGDNLVSILKQADESLYRAKKVHKNQFS